ncbi:MAG: helix-turn-helix domain-containing protein [Kiloniellales bacterium]
MLGGRMNLEPRIDVIAAALADRARATIVCALMDGRAYTAKELAYRARITTPTASFHLRRLLESGLIACHKQGRNRYYRLANAEVAEVVETLALAAPAEHLRRCPARANLELTLARSCYDHLAGRLGVELAQRLAETGALLSRGGDFSLTPRGIRLLAEIGLDTAAIVPGRRPLVRNCLDWTERRFHYSGVLATVLFDHFLSEAWLTRADTARALRVTAKGLALFRSKLQLDMTTFEAAAREVPTRRLAER